MFLSLIEKRRSIRQFQDTPVERDKIDRLVEAALRSPSSMGSNPWDFVVVTEKDLLGKLSKAKQHGSSFLSGAPLAIVVCGDPSKSTVWIEDCSIAAIFLHLAAHSMGLGSCWIQIRDRMHSDAKTSEAYISELLGLPEGLRIEAMVAIGYPDQEKPPHPKEGLLRGRIHRNQFGKPYFS